tara:strand:- start:1072 stop:2793 length:1722 start_codon:yes stop_codon:yes gene_type:complete
MKELFKNKFSTNISSSLLATLVRYIPPNEFNEALIDIVNVLMDGLSRGVIYIDMREIPINIELKYKGWPDFHRKILVASGWTEGSNSPIVLEGNRLSWRRTYNEKATTIQKILTRNKPTNLPSKELNIQTNEKTFTKLNQQQQKAVRLIKTHRLILLSGGPGTGKTYTILQMLLEAFKINSSLNIAMAAPTGKAAKKLKDTMQEGIKDLDEPFKSKLTQIPSKTLHRWLEAGTNGFRRNSQRLLELDLIVVDEMSMVDLTIITGLLDALPKSCQIILVGDPDQLLPIGSGGIWQILQSNEMKKHFLSNSVKLTKSYRNKGDIALLRNTLKNKGLDAFWHTLSISKNSSNVYIQYSSRKNIPETIMHTLYNYKKELKILTKNCIPHIPYEAWQSSMIEIIPSKEILNLFNFINSLLVLCPQRYGHWGIQKIHKLLLGEDLESGNKYWGEGTPIMSKSNQPDLGLANGDIGIIIGQGEERRFLFNVFSEDQRQVTRLINPSRLNLFEPAYAMTIHKSQGSEADQVLLLWPNSSKILKESNPINSFSEDYEKRIIYTAITRAKKQLLVITNKDTDF